MARPFPQFNGALQQYGRNDAWMWYNSLQVNYNLRLRNGITLLGNYTLVEAGGTVELLTTLHEDVAAEPVLPRPPARHQVDGV